MPPLHGPLVVGLGELLWDLLPSGPALGGAPANVAYWATQLGDRGLVASRVGSDALGEAAIARLAQAGVATEHIQRAPAAPTGTVRVALAADGQPSYEIVQAVAWDELAWTPDLEGLAGQADAICFGTLAQRTPPARTTIERVLTATRPETIRLLDLNLRPPFWSPPIVDASLRLANTLKLNDVELATISPALGLADGTMATRLHQLRDRYNLMLICLTRGAHGCLLLTAHEVIEAPGELMAVIDTVGAGDAACAALLHHLLRETSLADTAAAANRLGGWVATQLGAMPVPDRAVLRQVRS